MDIETKQVVRGKTTTVAILATDLEKIKAIRRKNESLTLTINRLLENVGLPHSTANRSKIF